MTTATILSLMYSHHLRSAYHNYDYPSRDALDDNIFPILRQRQSWGKDSEGQRPPLSDTEFADPPPLSM